MLVAARLEKEIALIRIETLKKQLDSHFLFNSLNVLLTFVKKIPTKSQHLLKSFPRFAGAHLMFIEQQVVTLKEEINFANSYFYLQKIRFGDTIKLRSEIDASMLNFYLPPLAIQTLLENALKHNRASNESLLVIDNYTESDSLLVKNNLQRKPGNGTSNGIGLKICSLALLFFRINRKMIVNEIINVTVFYSPSYYARLKSQDQFL